jgi:hypothetical protein
VSDAVEDPGAETIAAIVGEAPLALPQSIDRLEDAIEGLEDEIQEAGEQAAKAAVSGKRGGKV